MTDNPNSPNPDGHDKQRTDYDRREWEDIAKTSTLHDFGMLKSVLNEVRKHESAGADYMEIILCLQMALASLVAQDVRDKWGNALPAHIITSSIYNDVFKTSLRDAMVVCSHPMGRNKSFLTILVETIDKMETTGTHASDALMEQLLNEKKKNS